MGESTRSETEAHGVKDEFLNICREIKSRNLNSTISLDLSHIGLTVSTDLCKDNLSAICASATDGANEVIISAEGIESTSDVIEIYKWARKEHENVSITMQAYLHRSKDEFKDLVKEQGRIRVVKGAFDAPESVAIAGGDKLDADYPGYVEQLLSLNHKCSIATHHSLIQQEVKKLIDSYRPDKKTYEFEGLYGTQTDQLLCLKDEAYQRKLYFVYGKEWYLYLCNRIAEYPLNIFRLLDDIVN